MRNLRPLYWILALFMTMVLLIKLILPWSLNIYLNHKLEHDRDYTGSVKAVSIDILTPALTLHQLHITSRANKDPSSLDVRAIYLQPKILHLLTGQVQMRVSVEAPILSLTTLAPKAETPTPAPTYIWQVARAQLLPLPISEIILQQGRINYTDKTTNPAFMISAMDINAKVTGLQQEASPDQPLPALLDLSAKTLGDADVKAEIAFDPRAVLPHFDLKFSLKHLQLHQISNFLEAYTDLRAKSGEFNLLIAATANKGQIQGYAKPFFKDVQLTLAPADKSSLIKHLYKGFVQWLHEILKNSDTQHTATKIEFTGSVNSPDVSVWSTLVNLLRNAFLEALLPRFD